MTIRSITVKIINNYYLHFAKLDLFDNITNEMKKQSLLQFPLLVKEWDYEYNDTLPEEHSPDDTTEVYWKCNECDYQWKSSIEERVHQRAECPNCSFGLNIYSPEQTIYSYVKQAFPDSVFAYKSGFLEGMEVDIYIPSLCLAIEYDGNNWRHFVRRDSRKSELLKKNSIKLIRMKEDDCSNPYDDYAVIKSEYKNKKIELQSAISELFRLINTLSQVNIKLEGESSVIFALSKNAQYMKSLQASEADVLAEWAYELNGVLTPDKVSYRSWKKVWWKCSICGKEYQQCVKTKVNNGLGCDSCSQRLANEIRPVSMKKNSKAKSVSKNQYLLSEWDDTRDPATVSCNSKYIAQWKCSKCGNVFLMSVRSRTGKTQGGCPICRLRNNVAKKGDAVINMTTGKVYPSIGAAHRDTGIPVDPIRYCCLGKSSQAGGYQWKYADEQTGEDVKGEK